MPVFQITHQRAHYLRTPVHSHSHLYSHICSYLPRGEMRGFRLFRRIGTASVRSLTHAHTPPTLSSQPLTPPSTFPVTSRRIPHFKVRLHFRLHPRAHLRKYHLPEHLRPQPDTRVLTFHIYGPTSPFLPFTSTPPPPHSYFSHLRPHLPSHYSRRPRLAGWGSEVRSRRRAYLLRRSTLTTTSTLPSATRCVRSYPFLPPFTSIRPRLVGWGSAVCSRRGAHLLRSTGRLVDNRAGCGGTRSGGRGWSGASRGGTGRGYRLQGCRRGRGARATDHEPR